MIEILQFCNRLAVNIFDIYLMVRLLKTLFRGKLYDKRVLYATMSVEVIITLLIDYYTPYVWINLITSILLSFTLTCCFESNIWKKIGVTVGINMLLALSEMIIALPISIENFDLFKKASNGECIALFLSRIVFLIVVMLIQKIIVKEGANTLSRKVVVLEVIVFSTIISELLFLGVRKQEGIVIETAVLFAAEITVYLLIYLQDCLVELFASKEQACLIEKEKEYYQKEAMIIQQKQELQRQFRHDLKNRMQILRELAESENMAELKRYLSDFEKRAKEQETFSNTGNLIIDSTVNSKLQDTKEMGIEVACNVVLPASIEVNTDDMVVILGNLLDNAIEACERVKTTKYIKLFMKYETGCIIIRIKNSYDQILNKDGGKIVTRKKDKTLHGIGIKSIKSTVDKYNGTIEILSEGKEFIVDIMFYL